MKFRTFIVAATLASVAERAAADAVAAPSFVLTADAAVLEVTPRGAGRRFLELPPLEYLFRLRADCADTGEPTAFSLNVADSRITLDRSELAADGPSLELRLTVPSEQLAPVALSTFCVAPAPGAESDDVGETAAGAGRELLIRDVLAAQASLLCANGDRGRMTYAAEPLDLRLVCDRPDTETEAAAPTGSPD